MTGLENAESALSVYERSMEEGHPWLPGGLFVSNPGLDRHILVAMHEFVRVRRVEKQAKPARRVSLTDGKDVEQG